MCGLMVDWEDYDRVYGAAGLIPPKVHAPVHEDWMVYDDAGQRVAGSGARVQCGTGSW